MPRGAYTHKPTRFPSLLVSVDDEARAQCGGRVLIFKAGASLLLGDCVFLSAADTVNKSVTTGDHVSVVGIVVGGRKTNMEVVNDRASVGVITVAATDEDVLVQIDGIAYVIPDATDAAGSIIMPDDATTAGQVEAGTTATKVIGMLLETPTGAGAATKALIFRA